MNPLRVPIPKVANPVPDVGLRGLFIVVEGGDCCGKTTQLNLLKQYLTQRHIDFIYTREPGGTPMGKTLRDLVLNPAYTVDERTEALLYAADRATHVNSLIVPALQRGQVVVCDRYIDSSVAYQGYGRGMGHQWIRDLSTWATGGLVPHMTFLLDMDPASAAKRREGAPDRIESETVDFHERVRRGFIQQAQENPDRYTVIDASGSIDGVHNQIVSVVDSLLDTHALSVNTVVES